jgi:WD40 repeat protein
MEYSPDGSVLATWAGQVVSSTTGETFEASLVLWDAVSGEEIRSLDGLDVEWEWRNAISPDFRLVGTIDTRGNTVVLDMQTFEVLAQLPCSHPLAFSPDGELIAVGPTHLEGPALLNCEDPLSPGVVMWQGGERVLDLGPVGKLFDAEFNPAGALEGGRYLATGKEGGGLEVFDLRTGERVIGPVFEYTEELAFDPTGRYLAGGGGDGRAWALDLPSVLTGASLDQAGREFQIRSTLVADVDVSRYGVLALSSTSGRVWLYDLATGEPAGEAIGRNPSGWVTSAFSPDGSFLLYTDDVLRRFDLDTQRLVDLGENLVTREMTPTECETYLGVNCEHDG